MEDNYFQIFLINATIYLEHGLNLTFKMIN